MGAGEGVVIAGFMHRVQETGGGKTKKRMGDWAGAHYIYLFHKSTVATSFDMKTSSKKNL